MKQKIYDILEGSDRSYRARLILYFLIFVILLNLFLVVAESMPAYKNAPIHYFRWIDLLSVVVFTVEYGIRLWCCTVDPRYSHPITGRIKYAFTPMAIVDFLAVFPFYIPFFYTDLRFLRTLRVFRLFRVLKLFRYSDSVKLFGQVVRHKKDELLSSLLLFGAVVLLSACVIYFCENEAQPEAFSSIPAASWWSIITLTTIGYGDLVPITTLGKLVGSVVALFGIGTYALAVGILVTGFMEEFHKKSPKKTQCPHCGKEIEPDHTHHKAIM
ncbi:MAG: ion transporter [Chlamydiia bacterium]|nr:ion transporter [Chlamydiia bacterium]